LAQPELRSTTIATGDESLVLRFSTAELRGRAAARAFRRLNEQNIVLPIEPLEGRDARADITVRGGPNLRVMSAVLRDLTQCAPARRGTSEHVFFGVTCSGTSTVRKDDRELSLHAGDAVLIAPGAAGFRVMHAERVEFLGLRLPLSVLAPLVPELDPTCMTRISRASTALALLTSYVRTALDQRMLTVPYERCLIERHVYDLVALALSATRDTPVATASSVRSARLSVIQSDIVRALADPELSVASIAARHRITARYVHKLFEHAGQTFSQFVLRERLGRVHAMLTDHRFDHVSVSTLAFRVGFGDLSYFNRSFRRRYGRTPSQVRQG
jgi:AraC-like DNA-binding protein